MSVERRFDAGYREADTDEPGLIQEDDGTVWVVMPGGSRSQVGGSVPVVVKRISITPATPNLFTELDLGYEVQEGDLVSVGTSVTEAWDGDNPQVYVYLDGDAGGLPGAAIQQKSGLGTEDGQEGSGGAYQLINWPLGSYMDRMSVTADLKAVVRVDTPPNPTDGTAEIILVIFPVVAAS